MDNVSAVRYINHLGGTRSKALSDLAANFWQYCLNRHISLTAEYLPGQDNQEADFQSRHFCDVSLWKLRAGVFADLQNMWGPFSVDLFNSRLDHQLPWFFSWRPDPLAESTDAFLQNWHPERGYAFPRLQLSPGPQPTFGGKWRTW